MKKVGKIIGKTIWYLFEIVLILYVIAATSLLLCTNEVGFTQFGNRTDVVVDEDTIDQLSSYKENDVLLIKNEKFDDLNVGDKIYYYDTLNNQYIVREGTIMSKDGNNESALYFLEETGNAISDQRLIGVHEKTYAGLGTAYTIIKSQVGFLLLVILPIFLLFIYQVYRIIILIKDSEEE